MTMLRRLARHLTPSLLISVLALVVATSSGAYAVLHAHELLAGADGSVADD